MRERVMALLIAVALVTASCSGSDASSTARGTAANATEPAVTEPAVATPASTTSASTAPASSAPAPGSLDATVRPGVEQVAVIGATPGNEMAMLAADGSILAVGEADDLGSWLVRGLAGGTTVDVVDMTADSAGIPQVAGSQIRLNVDAPGGNRAVWVFETIAGGERVEIGLGGATASRLVLPVVPGIDPPAEYPACDSLRGQPCRPAPSTASPALIGSGLVIDMPVSYELGTQCRGPVPPRLESDRTTIVATYNNLGMTYIAGGEPAIDEPCH